MEVVEIEGVVEGFRTVRESWAVVHFSGGDGRFTATGHLASLEPGETVRLTGNWTETRFGIQLKTESYVPVKPSTAPGIIAYLTRISGVGEITAEKIVQEYGENALQVVLEDPNWVSSIPRITLEQAHRITEAVRSKSDFDDILIDLSALGLTGSIVSKILDWAGSEKPKERIEQNPYELCRIDGVGFLTADRIARRLGYVDDDSRRIAAGLNQTLKDASRNGHCCLPPRDLIERAAKLLEIPAARFNRHIESSKESGDLIERDERIYLPGLDYSERTVADRILHLLSQPIAEISYSPLVGAVTLSEEQLSAVKLALSSKVCFITGGPGTGKTTLTKAIVHSFLQAGIAKVALAAPTGKAADRLRESCDHDASTFHRLLEFHPEFGWGRNRANRLGVDVLLVDETSMADIHLARRLLEALEDEARVIFVGDADQLPSVGPGRFLRDCLDSQAVPSFRLTKIFRQAEQSRIIRTAHQILRGKAIESGTNPRVDDFFVSKDSNPDRAAQLVFDAVVKRVPDVFGFDPLRDIQVLTPMKKGACGTDNLNRRLGAAINPRGEQILNTPLRVGDRVIQTRNNYDLVVFNGQVGFIDFHDNGEKRVYVEIDGRKVEYKYSQIGDLSLAYACTIHKSQGSEYPCVVIVLQRYHHVLLQRDLLYTAVTRAKKLCFLVADSRSIHTAIRTLGGHSRYTGLTALLRKGNENA